MNKHPEVPPSLGERLLKRFVPPGVKGQSILGDAREEYLEHLRSSSRARAGLWYWKHVLSIGKHFAWRPRQNDVPDMSRHNRRRSRLGNLLYDLKPAIRLLFKKPGFTLAAVITLGLGIGANTTIFSVVHGVLLKPLPYPEPEQLVGVFRIDPELTGKKPTPSRLASLYAVPYAVYKDWQELSPVFDSSGAYATSSFALTGGDRPERIRGAFVTSGVFDALGVIPTLGRPFLPEDDQLGAPRQVILSHGLWQRRFGSDSNLLEQQVELNGVPHTVVGVMPPGVRFPMEEQDLWVTFNDEQKASTFRKGGWLQVIARLKPGLSLEQAQREMDAVAQRIGEAHPEEKEHGIGLFSRKDLVVADTRAGLLLLLGAVGLVLLIACANMANLLLVRASERRRELGVRQALGAGRGRLVVQHLGESAVLSIVGGIAGYFIAVASLGPLTASFPGGLPRAGEISVDYRLLVFAAGLSMLTGLVTGALPALRAARAPIVDVLRDGGRTFAGGRHRNRTQAALVVSEIAFAFVLLAGATLFVRSFLSLTSVEPGFVAENVLYMSVVLPNEYRDSEERAQAFFAELDERLGSLPGVRRVARADQMPFMGGLSFPPTSIESSEGIVEDITHTSTVTPEYFSTLKIPLVAGRELTEADRKGTQLVAVINETMARKYWPDEDPMGRRVRIDVGDDPEWLMVVGVVGDVKYRLNLDPFPEFYVPYAQWPGWYQTVLLETAIDPTGLAPSVQNALWAIDPDVPATVDKLEDRITQSDAVAGQRFQIYILGCLSGLAALLAVVGIYGVLAYTVTERSHEIGIRMALGAGARSVRHNILGRGLAMTGIGLTIGLTIAIAASRVMESLLFEVSPTDPKTLFGVAVLVAVAATAASYVPAYRATKVDPVEALKQE